MTSDMGEVTAVHESAVGDIVVVAARGPWFGHAGVITGIRCSDHTDLWAYRLAGVGGWWYADELAPAPHPNPEQQVPDGPARHIIQTARHHGWMAHVTGDNPPRVALISGPGADGGYLRVWATPHNDRWWWTVETFDRHATSTDGPTATVGTTDQLTQIIRDHNKADQ